MIQSSQSSPESELLAEEPAVDFLPFSLPDIGEEEIAAVVESLRSGWVTSGPAVAALEREFADFVGSDVEAVATSSATAGLHLALEACGVGPGDEVIVPTWTFTASAEVVRYLGATPVLVDVDPGTLNLDVDQVSKALTARTRAVMVVHLAGLSVDMPKLRDALAGHDIRIVEDAAHALPSRTNGVLVGTTEMSDLAVFSFYATKTMTTGEGGMITTRDPVLAARVRTMRLHGIDRNVFDRYRSTSASWAYDVVAPGYKYNLPDPAAAMGRVQLTRLGQMQRRRESLAARLLTGLADLPLDLPAEPEPGDLHSWHLFMVRLRPVADVSRDQFIEQMRERGIGCSVHFIPLHMHSYWRESLDVQDGDFPVASAEFRRVVSLPLYSKMTESDVERIIDATRDILLPP